VTARLLPFTDFVHVFGPFLLPVSCMAVCYKPVRPLPCLSLSSSAGIFVSSLSFSVGGRAFLCLTASV